MTSTLRCTRCQRRLTRPAFEDGDVALGRDCARKLAVKLGAKPKTAKVKAPKIVKPVQGWTQLSIMEGAAA